MRYFFFRFTLAERELPPMVKIIDGVDSTTRQEYLINIFSSETPIISTLSELQYVFIGKHKEFILGKIGKPKPEALTQGPETGFAEVLAQNWHTVDFIMDTSHHDDGQKIAVSYNKDVGKSVAILESLVKSINTTNNEAKWHISVNPITYVQDFWQAAQQNLGNIRELELTFDAPNMFGGKDATSKVLKDYKEKNNAQKTKVSLINSDGNLEVDQENVKDGMNLISKGGGRSKLTGKDREVLFDSKEAKQVSEKIEDEDHESLTKENSEQWIKTINKLFRQ